MAFLDIEIESEVLLNLVAVFVCITFAALMAGLTMGLLSLDPLDLLIKIRTSDPATSAQAQAVLPIVTNHHRLLVTLLLINAGANEALPLFLDELVPSYMAIILSVTLVLFCGEMHCGETGAADKITYVHNSANIVSNCKGLGQNVGPRGKQQLQPAGDHGFGSGDRSSE